MNSEHTTKIVNRLIKLLKIIPIVHYDNLKLIISEWTALGLLDNSVIDTLWKYFIKKIPVSDTESCAALQILLFAAIGRRTIVSRNIQLIDKVVFGVMEDAEQPRGMDNLRLTQIACDALSLMGMEKQSVTEHKPQFTISSDDQIWRNLFRIFEHNFDKPVRHYNAAMTSALDFLFKVCSKPYAICEEFATNIAAKLTQCGGSGGVKRFLISRAVHMFGEMALKMLRFFDENVYKELKRRHVIRQEREEEKKSSVGGEKKKKKKRQQVALDTTAARSASLSVLNESNRSVMTVSVKIDVLKLLQLSRKLQKLCNSFYECQRMLK